MNYKGDLDCQNYKTRAYVPNMISHTIYLDILYTSAVNIYNFFKGVGIAQEVSRTSTNSTVCRLIMGSNQETEYKYGVVFFDVNKAREKPTNIDAVEEIELNKPVSSVNIVGGFGGSVAEDRRMTFEAFNTLIRAMVPLTGNLCPQKPQTPSAMVDPFNAKIMPDLSCPGMKFGGKRKRLFRTRKNSRTKRRNTRRNRK